MAAAMMGLVRRWLAKEPYRPRRIARAIELVALLFGMNGSSPSRTYLP